MAQVENANSQPWCWYCLRVKASSNRLEGQREDDCLRFCSSECLDLWEVHADGKESVAGSDSAESQAWDDALKAHVKTRKQVYLSYAFHAFQSSPQKWFAKPKPRVYVVEVCGRYERNEGDEQFHRGFIDLGPGFEEDATMIQGIIGDERMQDAATFIVVQPHQTPSTTPVVFELTVCRCYGHGRQAGKEHPFGPKCEEFAPRTASLLPATEPPVPLATKPVLSKQLRKSANKWAAVSSVVKSMRALQYIVKPRPKIGCDGQLVLMSGGEAKGIYSDDIKFSESEVTLVDPVQPKSKGRPSAYSVRWAYIL